MPVFAGLSTGRVRITVQGKHLEVTEAINGYIDEKIGHAVQPFEEALRVREVDVKCSARGGENSGGPKLQTVEVLDALQCNSLTDLHFLRRSRFHD